MNDIQNVLFYYKHSNHNVELLLLHTAQCIQKVCNVWSIIVPYQRIKYGTNEAGEYCGDYSSTQAQRRRWTLTPPPAFAPQWNADLGAVRTCYFPDWINQSQKQPGITHFICLSYIDIVYTYTTWGLVLNVLTPSNAGRERISLRMESYGYAPYTPGGLIFTICTHPRNAKFFHNTPHSSSKNIGSEHTI